MHVRLDFHGVSIEVVSSNAPTVENIRRDFVKVKQVVLFWQVMIDRFLQLD